MEDKLARIEEKVFGEEEAMRPEQYCHFIGDIRDLIVIDEEPDEDALLEAAVRLRQVMGVENFNLMFGENWLEVFRFNLIRDGKGSQRTPGFTICELYTIHYHRRT